MIITTTESQEDFLTRQIIAYIGNKRRLLSFVKNTLELTLQKERGGFLDLFCGSGSVARLAKTLDFSVIANDWEFYAYVINQAYITTNNNEVEELFKNQGGFKNVLNELNNLTRPKKPYISLYYAPLSQAPDPDAERMFYTRENALKIDAIREKIEEWYPEWGKEKYLLTALLLYYAATHTNTSGVFKAYHRGFGGHGKDALKRILAPIHLDNPVLIDSMGEHQVFSQDANELVRELDWEKILVTYLDPPYNQHQYGSNYHILNTIALWDKPVISNDFAQSGKAGIRKDWIKTRSDYCYKDKATKKFWDLINHIHSRWVMISYNTEGIIPLDDMLEILKEKGRVKFYTDKYVKYRGGRQSLNRKVNNLEFLIVLDQEAKHTKEDDLEIESILEEKKLDVLKGSALETKNLIESGWQDHENTLHRNGNVIELDDIIFKGYHGDVKTIYTAVKLAHIEAKDLEIEALFSLNPLKYKKRILTAFKKIAHKKYEEQFQVIKKLIHKKYSHELEYQKILKIGVERGLRIK